MSEKLSTKDRILNEAFNLFAEKGYSEVFVGDIAEAVGIKAPSLYKHYKGKQEIFDSCVKKFSERMNEVRNELKLPDTQYAEISYENADMESIRKFAIGLFLFNLKDPVASKFRRMLMIERYRNPELNKLFEEIFINGAVEYEEKIFDELMKKGVLNAENAHLLALRFYSPIFYLLQKYDLMPDMENEAIEELGRIIEDFCIKYGNN